MGCFCAVPEEFYCEVLLLDESKLTLTTQQQGIKVGAGQGRVRGMAARRAQGSVAWCEGCHWLRRQLHRRAVGKNRSYPQSSGRG